MGTRIRLQFEKRLKIAPRGSHVHWVSPARDQSFWKSAVKVFLLYSHLAFSGGNRGVVNSSTSPPSVGFRVDH